jgi:hypothetical protein
LGEAHGARPRSGQRIARAYAVLQHLDRVEQLGAKQVLAAAEVGLRGKRLDYVVARLVRAERGLAAPDGEHELALDTQLALDLAEPLGVLGLQGTALIAELGEEGGTQILGRRARELGLALHLRLAGKHEVRQRQVGLDPAQRCIEYGSRDAHRLRLGPQAVEELAESRVRRLCAGVTGH